MKILFDSAPLKDHDGKDLVKQYQADRSGNLVMDDKGEPIPKEYMTAIGVVKEMLATDRKNDPLRVYDMVEELNKEGSLTLDSEREDLLEKVIKENERYTAIIRGQLLRLLRIEKIKDADELAKGRADAAKK